MIANPVSSPGDTSDSSLTENLLAKCKASAKPKVKNPLHCCP